MTDRIATLTVVLTKDLREDDAQELANAIARFGLVAEVRLGQPVDFMRAIEGSRMRRELGSKLVALFNEETQA